MAKDALKISDPSETDYPLALAFRERIGGRFFVHPRSVGLLCRKAYDSHPDWQQRLVSSIDRILNKGLPIYALQGPQLTKEFPWQQLPEGPGNDPLYPFRPHRFAFLPRLALATYQQIMTGKQLLEIVDSWIEEAGKGMNPYCYGTNLLVIQRILATVWAWTFLAGRPPLFNPEGLGLESRLLRILWADARFLASRIGLSAPNNHLLADRFAAYFLQVVVPEFTSQTSVDTEASFRDELLRQTYEDGGSFEHSAHYHEFACEMGVAYLLLAWRQGRQPDRTIRERVRALLHFQSALTGPHALPFALGNATEDTLFPLDDGNGWCSGSLREIYRTLFAANITPAPIDDPTIERAFWLLNGEIQESCNNAEADSAFQIFPESGIHVYPDQQLDGRLIFRTGPSPGSAVVAGHMHADLLSIYLSVNGQRVLDDAGTYTYRSSSAQWPPAAPAWRSYLAGSAAHNTLHIEGHDPLGEMKGDFRAFNLKNRVECRFRAGSGLAWSEGTLLEANLYTGYTRGCIHVEGCYWIIYDYLPPTEIKERLCWYGFQCAPGLQVSTANSTTLIKTSQGKTCLSLITTLPGSPAIFEGHTDPLGGWVSPRYGLILPAPQIRFSVDPGQLSRQPAVFILDTRHRSCSERVSAQSQADGTLVLRLISGVNEDLLIQSNRLDKPAVFEDLIFEGRLLWVRIEKGQPVMLRWLDGRRVAWQKQDLDLEFAEEAGEMRLR